MLEAAERCLQAKQFDTTQTATYPIAKDENRIAVNQMKIVIVLLTICLSLTQSNHTLLRSRAENTSKEFYARRLVVVSGKGRQLVQIVHTICDRAAKAHHKILI
jgi:hypothetical protein